MSLRICKSLYRYSLVLFESFKDLKRRLREKGLRLVEQEGALEDASEQSSYVHVWR